MGCACHGGPDSTEHRDPATHELVITPYQLHLDMMVKRLKERFHIEVTTKPPRIALKETVLARADGHYKHKKQTGGSGQFGEVYLNVVPRERGKGFEFVDDVVGGTIPRQFIPAVEKGIREALEHGVFAGYPVVDLAVHATDGKSHPVDSNETSFKIAGRMAFKDAFLKAKPCLLEPIVDLVVEIPAASMGDITGDLNSRRGRISGMDSVGSVQIIKAQMDKEQPRPLRGAAGSMDACEVNLHLAPRRSGHRRGSRRPGLPTRRSPRPAPYKPGLKRNRSARVPRPRPTRFSARQRRLPRVATHRVASLQAVDTASHGTSLARRDPATASSPEIPSDPVQALSPRASRPPVDLPSPPRCPGRR